ncbi:hypothetical protein KP509_14G022800 [Ceratopteris richardii]|uniref:N-alpha-acetyltransferase 60 n=1 Tax=Ceratopteris richardii TaxID=49495 RepID=A0A8T2T678_CERRI|nr:hypothetical protein KP509_14G022800 [Ceratopteris richardii]
MDYMHEGHPLLSESKEQHNRLISSRSVIGTRPTVNFQQPYQGNEYIPSDAVSWASQESPKIAYRPIRPSDLYVLKELHEALFPVKYETEFFLKVVHGVEIISWAAVDTSRPGPLCDEIIGFITTRVVSTADVDASGMLGFEFTKSEKDLVYILTLGVIKSYRKLGIATSLIQRVLEYAETIPTCRAVYLHVILYNLSAINFYEKNSFRCLQRLHNFYIINEQTYDAYLYIYYVNGGRAPCSALDFLVSKGALLWNFIASVANWFWRKEPDKTGKWTRLKSSGIWGSLCQSSVPMDRSISLCA